MRNLPRPGIESVAPGFGRWIPYHWTLGKSYYLLMLIIWFYLVIEGMEWIKM